MASLAAALPGRQLTRSGTSIPSFIEPVVKFLLRLFDREKDPC